MSSSMELSETRSVFTARIQKARFILVILLGISIVLELSAAFIIIPALSIVLMFAEERFDIRTTLSRVSGKGYFLTLIFAVQALWFLPLIFNTGSTRYLEKTLPFFLFPLMISSTSLDEVKLRTVFKSFVATVSASYLLSVAAAVYHFKYSVPRWGRPSDFFFHEQFTMGLFNIHPTYYGLLGCVATLLALMVLTGVRRILVVCLLTVIILLINARIALVIQALLIFSFILKGFSSGFSTTRFIMLILSGVVLFLTIRVMSAIYDYPHRKLLVNIDAAWDRSYAPDIGDADGGIVMRMAMWRSAITVIRAHPFLGVGLGYEDQFMVAEYRRGNFTFLADNGFNAHNQALSYLIGVGVLGFGLLGAVYIRLISEAYRKKCWVYFIFIAMFACVALTESIFNRLLGISLFAFFNALIMLKLVHHDK